MLLNRAALTLIIGLTFCGCSDAPKATTEEVVKPPTIAKPSTSHNRPASETATKPQKLDGPSDVIVEGPLAVDVMEIVVPPRANELGQRLKNAVRANPDWWLEHAKKANPGEPLPYDTRLGLSEAEYSEFLSLSSKMTTRKKAEATLVVTKNGDDVYVLDGGQALPDFTGIEIDFENDLVRTSFGALTERSEIDAPEDAALGAWVGTQWKLERFNANDNIRTVAEIAFGKLKRSDRYVIYYDVRRVSPNGKTRVTHVLNYSVPPRESRGVATP